MTTWQKRHAGGLVFALITSAMIAFVLALGGCATVAQQPVEARLAAACTQAAALYKDASLLYATNNLGPAGVAVFTQAEPVVNAACDPDHPATDPQTALASLAAVLNQMALAKAAAGGK